MKTEVYSWRLSTDLKTALEREAQRRKISLSLVLDLAARDFLQKSAAGEPADDEQARLHEAAMLCIGTFASGKAGRSENVREVVRKRLRRAR